MNPIVPNPSAALSPRQPSPPEFDPADIPYPNLDDLVTEDGAPVDNLFAEKQYRLLTEPLYGSWTPPGEDRRFIVATDVGIFYKNGEPPLVPDCFLSLGVAPGPELRAKENRSYFQWIYGKMPDVVIEIVSDKHGGEEHFKKDAYARLGVPFYVIFDPDNHLRSGNLRVFSLHRRKYQPTEPHWFPEVGLGMTLWPGIFEGYSETWLRWCDRDGRVIPTGSERAGEATRKIDEAIRKIDEATQKADEATQKAERLAAQLRALGVNPEV